MKKKVVVLTGGTSGIGLEVAAELARQGQRLYLVGRESQRAKEAREGLQKRAPHADLQWVECELADLSSVSKAADQIRNESPQLDLLIANAGLCVTGATTKDGFEICFGVNYLAHVLLAKKLEEPLRKSQGGRLVHVTSRAHFNSKAIPYELVRKPGTSRYGFTEYGHSKLAQIYHARDWAKRVPAEEAGAFSVHPGMVSTNVWRHSPSVFQRLVKPFMRTSAQGAQTVLYCAQDPALQGMTGVYSENGKIAAPAPQALNDAQATELAERTESWLRPFYKTRKSDPNDRTQRGDSSGHPQHRVP